MSNKPTNSAGDRARGPHIERLALCGAQSICQAGRVPAPAHAVARLRHSGKPRSRRGCSSRPLRCRLCRRARAVPDGLRFRCLWRDA